MSHAVLLEVCYSCKGTIFFFTVENPHAFLHSIPAILVLILFFYIMYFQVCREWEGKALEVDKDVRLALIRIGVVLGKDGGALGSFNFFSGFVIYAHIVHTIFLYAIYSNGCCVLNSAKEQLFHKHTFYIRRQSLQ